MTLKADAGDQRRRKQNLYDTSSPKVAARARIPEIAFPELYLLIEAASMQSPDCIRM